jgi:hypothetical protein
MMPRMTPPPPPRTQAHTGTHARPRHPDCHHLLPLFSQRWPSFTAGVMQAAGLPRGHVDKNHGAPGVLHARKAAASVSEHPFCHHEALFLHTDVLLINTHSLTPRNTQRKATYTKSAASSSIHSGQIHGSGGGLASLKPAHSGCTSAPQPRAHLMRSDGVWPGAHHRDTLSSLVPFTVTNWQMLQTGF